MKRNVDSTTEQKDRYRKRITEMIGGINNEGYLRRIYLFVSEFLEQGN